MCNRILNLVLLNDEFGIIKLARNERIPQWFINNDIYTLTRTEKELTLVCPSRSIPNKVKFDGNSRCLKVEGTFNFDEIGIIASIAHTLAQNNISIFVFSSYDTDYILIKKKDIERAIKSLENKGHCMVMQSG
ncbi:ACT domain-containing protein [candidate division KSB1 bacterium]|nr:ACT domain-containing protein [candidate division KSB1 bacterium]